MLTASSGLLKVKSATWIQREQLAYNMEVQDFHTYFVGTSEMWVHNHCNIGGNKQTGSYTVEHESGTKYHGKGPESRAKQSAREKAAEHDDPVKSIDWKPEASNKDAFKAEARRIREDGGVGEEFGNYNKINSPGEKMLKANGE